MFRVSTLLFQYMMLTYYLGNSIENKNDNSNNFYGCIYNESPKVQPYIPIVGDGNRESWLGTLMNSK